MNITITYIGSIGYDYETPQFKDMDELLMYLNKGNKMLKVVHPDCGEMVVNMVNVFTIVENKDGV